MSRFHQPRDRIKAGDWLLLHDTDGQLHVRRLNFEKHTVAEVQGLASALLPAGADPDERPSLEGGSSDSFAKSGKALSECRRRLERWQTEGWIVVAYGELYDGMAEHHVSNDLLGLSLAETSATIVQKIRDRWSREEDRERQFERIGQMKEAIDGLQHERLRTLLAEHGAAELHAGLTKAAVRVGDQALLAMLLDAGAPVNDEYRDQAPLAIAAEANDASMVALLLDHGADIDGYGRHGRRALHDAAVAGANEAIAVLLDRGAGAMFEDRWGASAVELAAERGHEEAVELLLPRSTAEHRERAEAKRDEGRRRKERSSDLDPRVAQLLWAAFRNRPEEIQRLLAAGVSVNARAPDGRSAFDVAVSRGNDELAQMLIDEGAEN